MRSTAAEIDHRSRHLSKIPVRLACIAILGVSQLTPACIPASAMNVGVAGTLSAATANDDPIIQVRAVVHGGRAAVGPHGGAVVHRGGAAVGPGGAAYRGRTAVVGPRGNVAVTGRGGWARPGWYRWPRGGAIAAGAAIGFVTAATAVAWAGAAPAPGMCWYYTDPSRTQGFWDYCP